MIIQNDIGVQVAALPVRADSDGNLSVLMITSRDTKRWVVPKGWLIDDSKPWETAKTEALEEAGALGQVSETSIGFFHYDKGLADGTTVDCRVTVYPMRVDDLKSHWKERAERTRQWFDLPQAARLVNEPELSNLLSKLHSQPEIRASAFFDDVVCHSKKAG